MDFIDKQIAPPKSWEKFEDLTRALFAAIWQAPLTQKNGRAGQKQHGVDVYGIPANKPNRTYGVQCKGKNGRYGSKATIAEFDAELAKAEKFSPALAHWTFATTSPNDAKLQEHARLVSEGREREGLFPVDVIGWDTIHALLSNQLLVAEEFYPEHTGNIRPLMETLRALPSAEQLRDIRQVMQPSQNESSNSGGAVWSEVRFETARDLGPALMGRPLGPADVAACPILPETAVLLADLKRAGSARLSGVAGAGKSICMLQVGRQLFDRGWRVLRLNNPSTKILALEQTAKKTLHIVDDAHLICPTILRNLEENATATSWILSAHTTSEGRNNQPGTIQLDAKRAVQVIADGLRANPKKTLEAVKRADDRVGDRPQDERLDFRIDHAAEHALFPWQFCFILGGGWRRASALADASRAANADFVLAAVAIRQLASRDAQCPPEALLRLLGEAVTQTNVESATEWLVGQRLLISSTDLRCPHQRLSGVLLDQILFGRDLKGRQAVAGILRLALSDNEMPLAGIALLLSELTRAGGFPRWQQLIAPVWLIPALQRCWSAVDALDVRHACWVLSEASHYLPDSVAEIASHKEVLAGWIEQAQEGTCYALGPIINGLRGKNDELRKIIVTSISPITLARLISEAKPLHACEIASLVATLRLGDNEDWKRAYLSLIDRPALLRLVSEWPETAPLSAIADLCRHLCDFEFEFGLAVIEALIPAIAERLRAEPQESFHEINDIVWHSLRLYDPLNVYVGKFAPTRRMKQVAHKICDCWSPVDLAAKLSKSSKRNFQAAAGLLSFMRKAAPNRFRATTLALDWSKINETIGIDWGAEDIGDAHMLLWTAYTLPAVRPAIEAMIAKNESHIITLSVHLAALAPNTAMRHIVAGGTIGLTHLGTAHWNLGALILARVAKADRSLVASLLNLHLTTIASAFSQLSPTFYNDALLFVRLLIQEAPYGMKIVLDSIDSERAAHGWRNALSERHNNQVRGAKSQARQVVSLLVQSALERDDKIGHLARQLRREFPKASVPPAAVVEPIDLSTAKGL